MNYRKQLPVLLLVTAFLFLSIAPLWAEEGKININKATVEELAKLKHVGPKYAERIVQFRNDQGPFQAPEDIMKVPGIGAKIFEVNRELITVQ
ncbi:MAG: ComEA family DNA-binding protein [Deltaproteobacteria bacterium]|nr:ComEA family DNA-binding protein [Deltaproteobacteria bacterium]